MRGPTRGARWGRAADPDADVVVEDDNDKRLSTAEGLGVCLVLGGLVLRLLVCVVATLSLRLCDGIIAACCGMAAPPELRRAAVDVMGLRLMERLVALLLLVVVSAAAGAGAYDGALMVDVVPGAAGMGC